MSVGNFANVLGSADQAFNCAKGGNFSGVFSQSGEVVKNIFHFVGFGWSIYEIYNLIQRKDLKNKQKILPIVGYGLTGAAALACGIVLCAGATLVLPPLIFVASVFNVVRNIGVYFKERSERKNLEKQFKNEQEIDHKISQLDLPEKLRHDVRDFIKLSRFDKHKIQELYVRIGHHFINKTAKEQQDLTDLIHKSKIENLSPKEKSSLRKQIRSKEKALNERFTNNYGELFTLLEKKQRIHFLKKNAKSRIANIAISVGVALLSLATMVLVAVLGATPAAPGAVLAYGVLGGVSIGLSAVAAANSSKMALQELRSKNKVAAPFEEVGKAVYPSLKTVDDKSENKHRSDVLYDKSAWGKFKNGLQSMWSKLWGKSPEDTVTCEKPQSAIKEVIAQISGNNFTQAKLSQETPIPKGNTAKRRAQFTSHYNAQDASPSLAQTKAQAISPIKTTPPKKS